MTELKDWLNSINQTKKNLIDEDPSIEKDYPPYIIKVFDHILTEPMRESLLSSEGIYIKVVFQSLW